MQINTIKRISVLLGVFLLALVAAHSVTGRISEPLPPAAPPDEVARQFYHWYMQARMPEAEGKNLATFRKYITRQFLKQEMDPEVDAKLFVDAQDLPEPLNDVFSVSKATIRGQQATVQVILKGKKVHYKLRVTLRQENGAWKIDDVKGQHPQ